VIRAELVIRNIADFSGRPIIAAIRDGRILAWGSDVPVAGPELDGQGATLLPGLHDHHIHIMASAARLCSVDLSGLASESAVIETLRSAAASKPSGAWIRAIGYDERAAGLPDAARLDGWLPAHALRMQDRTGALWMLNQAGLDILGCGPYPPGVELTPSGCPAGRIWREDVWLRVRIGAQIPDLACLGAQLAHYGLTGLSDASAHNGPPEAGALTMAHACGDLPQRLMILGREELPASECYAVGPVKIVFDERDLPGHEAVESRIRAARRLCRPVAAHCVTLTELLFFLSALEASGGACPGDRIEHGGIIPASLLPELARTGLTIVTNPAFIHDRGDRYLREVDAEELADLYRLGSLSRAGIPVAAGSDGPYGALDPLVSVRAALTRRTSAGTVIGPAESISFRAALGLYLGSAGKPARPRWCLLPGDPADLCLIDGITEPDRMRVTATVIGGRIHWLADR
jgi:predicted amidohydrolase YtcJ